MKLSKKEFKKLKLEKQRNESERIRQEVLQRKSEWQKQLEPKEKKKKKKYIIGIASFVIILLVIGLGLFFYYSAPGYYDEFAKCLTERGAVMYGAIEWCKYSQAQASMFGKSFKYINYKDYTEGPESSKKPTWVIDGKKYEGLQSFETLSGLTGCVF